MKMLLADYTLPELEAELAAMNLPKFRAKQLCKWLSTGADFPEMTDIPLPLRSVLAEKYDAIGIKTEKIAISKDGTIKFLLGLTDGNLIESVLMSYKHGYTLCVSTQVGCRMGCVFCASGKDGLLRDLTGGEILSQIIAANKYLEASGGHISNVVLMGSGEPLDNYDNVTKFIRLAFEYLNIGQRSISVSTCGLVPNIIKLADEGYNITLCISLHATTDELRRETMPIAKKYKISEIIDAAKYYFEKSGRRVLFEYAMIKGINDSESDAARLRNLTSDFPTHINLIPLNDTGIKYCGTPRREAEKFCTRLVSLGASATIRRSLGTDISGACGQLRNQYVGRKDPVSSEKKP